MSRSRTERVVHLVGAAGAVVVAATAVPVSGELELFLVMLTAVMSGLVCFDTAMARDWKSFTPWFALSIAPVVRIIPVVWSDLQSEESVVDERFDHLGALLFGIVVLFAVWWISRPSSRLGMQGALHDSAVIVGTAATVGVAGTSVAFLYDADFGSVTVARLLESSTWTVVGGLLAVTVLAASRPVRLTPPVGSVLIVASATAGLLAYSVAGSSVDQGWWAVLFAGFALSAGGFSNAELGQRDERTRRTSAGVVVALIVGLGAAAAAISARSDSDAWGPGWWVLGAMSLAMLALAMASRPVDEQRLNDGTFEQTGAGFVGANAEDRAAMFGPESGAEARLAAMLSTSKGAGIVSEPSSAVAVDQGGAGIVSEPSSAVAVDQAGVSRAGAEPETALGAAAATASRATAFSVAAEVAPAVRPTAVAAGAPAAVEGIHQVDQSPAVVPVTSTQPSVGESPPDVAGESPAPAATGDLATSESKPSTSPDQTLDPIGRTHHVDPSTGLLSAAGLHHALAEAFASPPGAGHVTLMMFMVRDLDEVENQHGRLASAAVTRSMAERVAKLMPHGTGARFARSGYAVVFEGDLGDPKALVQHLTRVLLELRTPVNDPTSAVTLGDRIDVVAGMAQSYAGEHAVDFVKRANLGLARAAQTIEPTFVAMP